MTVCTFFDRSVTGNANGDASIAELYPAIAANWRKLNREWDRAQLACDETEPCMRWHLRVVLIARPNGWQVGVTPANHQRGVQSVAAISEDMLACMRAATRFFEAEATRTSKATKGSVGVLAIDGPQRAGAGAGRAC
jgi:hypothetical protein